MCTSASNLISLNILKWHRAKPPKKKRVGITDSSSMAEIMMQCRHMHATYVNQMHCKLKTKHKRNIADQSSVKIVLLDCKFVWPFFSSHSSSSVFFFFVRDCFPAAIQSVCLLISVWLSRRNHFILEYTAVQHKHWKRYNHDVYDSCFHFVWFSTTNNYYYASISFRRL